VLTQELSQSRKQYFELLKAYQELESASQVQTHSQFEVEELREQSMSMRAQIEEFEAERMKQLDMMATIIQRNEELENELKIVTRALELQS